MFFTEHAFKDIVLDNMLLGFRVYQVESDGELCLVCIGVNPGLLEVNSGDALWKGVWFSLHLLADVLQLND